MVKYDYLIADVDGVLTDGGHFYTRKGKIMKKFGSNDKDALKIILEKFVEKIIFVSSDKKGFQITKKRIASELGYKIVLIDPDKGRKSFLECLNGSKVYVGDGIYDASIFSLADLSIALADSTPQAKDKANYTLETSAGKNVFPHLLSLLESLSENRSKNTKGDLALDKNSSEDLDSLISSLSELKSSEKEISSFCSSVAKSYTGRNKIVFCGVGKNATLSEMVCEFLHPFNVVSITLDPHRAVHGNLGILNKEDVLVLSTKSGNTAELIYFLECLEKKMDMKNKFLVTSNSMSKLSRKFGFKEILVLPSEGEIAQFSHSPQTTIFLYTAIMMILVNRIVERKKISEKDYLLNHQAGEIGKALKNG